MQPHSATLLPVWCWRWRNKEGAAGVVVVLESCHQQRGQHHQQQRPEPAPRCSRSCGISSSTDVGSWKSSLPSSAIRSRTGRPWGARQETNLSIKAGADTLHCAHLWVEGVAWAGVGGECLRLRDASTVKSLSLSLYSLLAADNNRVGTLATLRSFAGRV